MKWALEKLFKRLLSLLIYMRIKESGDLSSLLCLALCFQIGKMNFKSFALPLKFFPFLEPQKKEKSLASFSTLKTYITQIWE